MKVYLADSNVALDLATVDPVWLTWSQEQLRLAAAVGEVLINPIIYAEIAPAFQTEAELAAWFGRTEMRKAPLPYEAAWSAAQAFARYKKAGGTRISLLPDFYIGAHAEVEGLTSDHPRRGPLSHVFPERDADCAAVGSRSAAWSNIHWEATAREQVYLARLTASPCTLR